MAYHALGRKADSDAALAALIAKDQKDAPTTLLTSMPTWARLIRHSRGPTRRSRGDGGLRGIVSKTCSTRSTPTRAGCRSGQARQCAGELAKIEFKVTLRNEDGDLRRLGGMV